VSKSSNPPLLSSRKIRALFLFSRHQLFPENPQSAGPSLPGRPILVWAYPFGRGGSPFCPHLRGVCPQGWVLAGIPGRGNREEEFQMPWDFGKVVTEQTGSEDIRGHLAEIFLGQPWAQAGRLAAGKWVVIASWWVLDPRGGQLLAGPPEPFSQPSSG